ncbi:MAG: hypothetical protein HYZ27_11805 [Deltaproteobacteria bacterium]|nr:hypothetical protein [Deltaproteobacteria bacterium]
MNLRAKLAVGLLVVVAAPVVQAQSIDEALRLYKGRDYEEAARAFYDVLSHDANPDRRDQATIYLAETLRKMGLLFPALYYYSYVFEAGRTNRYYLNAVDGLLGLQQELHDPFWVPKSLDEKLDPEGFGQLDADKIAQINYLVGELSFWRRKDRDARAFLEFVPPESQLYGKARYLLGILAVRANNPDKAGEHFATVLKAVDPETPREELQAVRSLALLGAARNAYGKGRYKEATEYYAQVPRFSESWFYAIYENAWATFRQEEYGLALGELQSALSPYFAKRHAPEAYVIQGTSYFANCQWDRVRRAVAKYKETYEPMLAQLEQYLKTKRPAQEIYGDVVRDGGNKVSAELAREVRSSKRFKDYHHMLTHIAWERQQIESIKEWRKSRLVEDIKVFLKDYESGTEQLAGAWGLKRLRELRDLLQTFQNQINILDFEVTDAERLWLEQGREILKGRRARVPRPDIPNDQWQHWSFDREYWKDELGYIQHSLRSECF